MKIEIVSHLRLSNGGRRREWVVRKNAEEVTRFITPLIFSGVSPSGNQINKLTWIYNIWRDRIDVLMSIYDVYCCTQHIQDKLCAYGLGGFFASYIDYLNKIVKARGDERFKDLQKSIGNNKPKVIKRPTMLDSGGFSLSSPKTLSSAFSNQASYKLERRDFFRKLIRIVVAIESRKYLGKQYDSDIESVQQFNLEEQLKLKPTFILTLDKVVRNHNWPINKKRAIAQFGIKCSKYALKYKSINKNKFGSLLLAVIHPIGPGPKEIAEHIGYAKGSKRHEKEMYMVVNSLCEEEAKLGVKFDGFAVGSLVPIQNYDYLHTIAEGIGNSLVKLGVEDRFLHGLGATNRKVECLLPYGFDSFDTTLHFRHARNRYIYSEKLGYYTQASRESLNGCTCPLCSQIPLDLRLDNREGMKEFATVCLGLHNFFVNHLEFVENLRNDVI